MESKNNGGLEEFERLHLSLKEQIERAKKYINKCTLLEERNIEGACKLTKKIKAELKFLNEVSLVECQCIEFVIVKIVAFFIRIKCI